MTIVLSGSKKIVLRGCFKKHKSCSRLGLDVLKMVITSEIVCRTGTVRGQAKKNNVLIPRKTGKSTIVTHGMIRVNVTDTTLFAFHFVVFL